MIDLNNFKLGETDQLITVATQEDFKQLLISMSRQAQHRIWIFSHNLDIRIYDNNELYEAIKNLAIRSPRTHINILVQDSEHMVKHDHSLLRLAQRISSHIQVKITAREHQDIYQTFIIFDDRGYIIHEDPIRFNARGNFYDPLETRKLAEQFSEMWEMGIIDNRIRRLSL
jgi:hypothetical protein